jgi:hypothetical protein
MIIFPPKIFGYSRLLSVSTVFLQQVLEGGKGGEDGDCTGGKNDHAVTTG